MNQYRTFTNIVYLAGISISNTHYTSIKYNYPLVN